MKQTNKIRTVFLRSFLYIKGLRMKFAWEIGKAEKGALGRQFGTWKNGELRLWVQIEDEGGTQEIGYCRSRQDEGELASLRQQTFHSGQQFFESERVGMTGSVPTFIGTLHIFDKEGGIGYDMIEKMGKGMRPEIIAYNLYLFLPG